MAKKNKEDFKSPFVPISELGMSEEGFFVDVNDMYNALYESYCACCHSEDADTCPSSEFDFGKDSPLEVHDFATTGRAGQYMWYSLTSVYDESLHTLDNFKKMHNQHHIEAANDPLESPSNNLQHAINNCQDLVSMCRNTVVINILDYSNYFGHNYDMYGNFLNYLHHMAHFFSTNLVSDLFSEIEREGKKYIRINPALIKDKDVIIPQIFANQMTLNLFKRVSKFICKNGAKSVIGLFITRIKPTADGREPKQVSSKYAIQPLGPRFFGGLGIPCI